MAKVRVALAGVGNCASALVQGVYFYAEAGCGKVPGLLHSDFGGYRPGDIEFVAAFDVDGRKVGKDLADAIFESPTTRGFSINRLGPVSWFRGRRRWMDWGGT